LKTAHQVEKPRYDKTYPQGGQRLITENALERRCEGAVAQQRVGAENRDQDYYRKRNYAEGVGVEGADHVRAGHVRHARRQTASRAGQTGYGFERTGKEVQLGVGAVAAGVGPEPQGGCDRRDAEQQKRCGEESLAGRGCGHAGFFSRTHRAPRRLSGMRAPLFYRAGFALSRSMARGRPV